MQENNWENFNRSRMAADTNESSIHSAIYSALVVSHLKEDHSKSAPDSNLPALKIINHLQSDTTQLIGTWVAKGGERSDDKMGLPPLGISDRTKSETLRRQTPANNPNELSESDRRELSKEMFDQIRGRVLTDLDRKKIGENSLKGFVKDAVDTLKDGNFTDFATYMDKYESVYHGESWLLNQKLVEELGVEITLHPGNYFDIHFGRTAIPNSADNAYKAKTMKFDNGGRLVGAEITTFGGNDNSRNTIEALHPKTTFRELLKELAGLKSKKK